MHIRSQEILKINYIFNLVEMCERDITYLRSLLRLDHPDISFVMSNDVLLRNNYFICKERLIVTNANSLTSIPGLIEKHLCYEIDLRRIKPRCFG